MKKASIKPKKRRETHQARASGAGVVDKLHAYLRNHAQALFSSLGRLTRSPFTSLMTISVLAIAISLAGGFYLLISNVEQLTGKVESSNQISLFLKLEISDKRGRELAARIAEKSGIEQVKLITKQQALDEFRGYSGFGDALKALDKNPLPAVIQVLPANTLEEQRQLQPLLADLQQLAEVDFAQMDMQWIKRLQSIMQLAQRVVGLLSILLGIAVLFITGNTIRLELQSRRDEVLISKLIGATHAFIQRPFLYSGFWYGFTAGTFAWLIVTVMMFSLRYPIEKLSTLYEGRFNVLFFSFSESLLLLLISSLLGIIGAWMVLVYQLQQLKPE